MLLSQNEQFWLLLALNSRTMTPEPVLYVMTGKEKSNSFPLFRLQYFVTKVQLGIKSVTSQMFRNCACQSITSFVRVLALLNLCLPQISRWSI